MRTLGIDVAVQGGRRANALVHHLPSWRVSKTVNPEAINAAKTRRTCDGEELVGDRKSVV